jgi:hypothetical protein
MEAFGPLLLFVVSLILYFGPALIASGRKHKSASAILVLNLFLGWTFLGWIAALVWAYTDDGRSRAQAGRPSMAPGGE